VTPPKGRTVRALCVKEPWASLQVRGIKTAEIRSRRTEHRGELLIVASLQPDHAAARIWATAAIPLTNLGMAIGFVHIEDCVPFTFDLAGRACLPWKVGDPTKRWAWLLDKSRARRIEPFPVHGRLGLFNVPDYYEVTNIQ
jgi:hypothetical protein